MFSQASSTASSSSNVDPLSYELPIDIDPSIDQPTVPVIMFCWVVGQKGGNTVFRCKLCFHQFTGSPILAMTHFDSRMSNQQLKQCKAPLRPALLKEQIKSILDEKKVSEVVISKKRQIIDLSAGTIGACMVKQSKPLADAAVLEFLVTQGLAASFVDSYSFRKLLNAVRDAGPSYLPPSSHALGKDSTRGTNPDGLGLVLHSELVRCRQIKTGMLNGISCIGGTICNDGAKWRKRSLINSVLMTANGPFFCQSTDATGLFKGADYLLKDIKSAIRCVGAENVFIVSLDGACKKTLRLIENEPTMHRIFPQRCTTHGCNLLIADIGKLFKWEITLCVRLVKFVCNHDSVFAILKAIPGALQLLGAVETRFASQIYSSERILADKIYLKEMFHGAAIREYMRRAPQDQNDEYTALQDDLISNAVAWERIRIFVAIEDPFRQLLRISDGHEPNLHLIAYGFEVAKIKSTAAVVAAEAQYPELYPGLKNDVDSIVKKRKKDIVSTLCLAAAMVSPGFVYLPEGDNMYDPEGGKEALMAVIDRYYRGDIVKQIEALKVYQDFREKTGTHFGSERMKYMAQKDSADNFWKVSKLAFTEGSELFKKLVNGYAGQGESERMNKMVKKFRSTERNRQTHIVTSSYMELDIIYKMIRKSTAVRKKAVYIDSLREIIEALKAEYQEEMAEQDEARAGGEVDEVAEEDEVEDAEYAVDAPDEGRNALFDLLIAAAENM